MSDREEARTPEQTDEAREGRDTGGDAPAAGSVEEREDVARDDTGGAGFPDQDD